MFVNHVNQLQLTNTCSTTAELSCSYILLWLLPDSTMDLRDADEHVRGHEHLNNPDAHRSSDPTTHTGEIEPHIVMAHGHLPHLVLRIELKRITKAPVFLTCVLLFAFLFSERKYHVINVYSMMSRNSVAQAPRSC